MASYVNNIVYSITPSPNQVDVAVTAKIVVVFSESMNGETLNQTTMPLMDGSKVIDATYDYNGIKKELTITPVSSLSGDQTYKVSILTAEAGPQTAFGNLSNKPYTFYFTTQVVTVEEDIPVETIEEPVDNSVDNPVDNYPIENDLFSTVTLIDSYPKEGDLVLDLPMVVLSFDRAVNKDAIAGLVYLREKALSPLLSRLNNANKLTFTLDAGIDDKTISLTPTGTIKRGTAYELVVESTVSDANNPDILLGIDHVIGFQMQWEIFYSSVASVKLILGLFGEMYTDAEIAAMVYQESLAVYQLMSMQSSFDALVWAETVPYAATQYVLYRTAYQSMLGQIIANSSGMKKSIKLGDLSVSESSTVSSEVTDLIGLFENEMKKWWNLLNGIEETIEGIVLPKLSTKTGSATRGTTDYPYPDWMTRVPYKELGG